MTVLCQAETNRPQTERGILLAPVRLPVHLFRPDVECPDLYSVLAREFGDLPIGLILLRLGRKRAITIEKELGPVKTDPACTDLPGTSINLRKIDVHTEDNFAAVERPRIRARWCDFVIGVAPEIISGQPVSLYRLGGRVQDHGAAVAVDYRRVTRVDTT